MRRLIAPESALVDAGHEASPVEVSRGRSAPCSELLRARARRLATLPRLAALATALACAGGGPTASAGQMNAAADRGEVLVTYAGLSVSDPVSQPTLDSILLASAARDGNQRQQLLAGLDGIVAEANTSRLLTAVTAHPIVLDATGARATIAEVTGRAPASDIGEEIRRRFAHWYALIFVATYEDELEESLSFRHRLGDETRAATNVVHSVGVSALLMDVRTREIVLSASALGLAEALGLAAGVGHRSTARSAAFTEIYIATARRALELLGDTAHQHGLLDAGRWDRYTVTGAWVETDDARAIIGWVPPFDPTADRRLGDDLCDLGSGCQDAACRRFEAFLVHSLSAALSRAGALVMPPFRFASFEGRGDWELATKLQLPTGRGTLFDPNVRLSSDPRLSRYKLAAVVAALATREEVRDDVQVVTRLVAKIAYLVGESASGECAANGRLELRPRSARHGAIAERQHVRARSHAPPGSGQLRLLAALALNDASDRLTDDLERLRRRVEE